MAQMSQCKPLKDRCCGIKGNKSHQLCNGTSTGMNRILLTLFVLLISTQTYAQMRELSVADICYDSSENKLIVTFWDGWIIVENDLPEPELLQIEKDHFVIKQNSPQEGGLMMPSSIRRDLLLGKKFNPSDSICYLDTIKQFTDQPETCVELSSFTPCE